MSFTILPTSALIAVVAGAIIIAKAGVSTSDERLVGRGADNANAYSWFFGVLDDQRIETAHGLSLIVFGSVLLLLYMTGIALQPAAVIIIAAVVLIFLVAHTRYARQLRATQPARFAALRVRFPPGQDRGDPRMSEPDHGTVVL